MRKFIFFSACLVFVLSSTDFFTQSLESGSMTFTNSDQFDESIEPNYISSTNISTVPYLSMHFTLEQPLINSLKEIGPKLSNEELLQDGNFMFRFSVDDKEIFVHSLNSGAGTDKSKTEQLVHHVPLMYPERIDYWGWFTWLRFMKMHGGQDALSPGSHEFKIEICCYLNKENDELTECTLAEGLVELIVDEVKVDPALCAYQEIQSTDDWEISSDKIDRSKIEELNKKIAQNRFEQITSIAVIKNGELLMEEYFNNSDRNQLHDTRSVGKTFASTMIGIAIEEEYIESENMQLSDFYDLEAFTNYHVKKDEVKLKDLLTMSSSLLGNDEDWGSPGNEENMYPTDDWVKFTLDLPVNLDKTSGQDFEYFTAGVVVLGDVIHKSVPGGLTEYTNEKLFQPLGIEKYKWQFTPQNIGNTAGGLQLTTLGYAKYGQLYKNDGKWKGQQLIPSDWVQKSLDRQVEIKGRDNENYGYLFWNKTYTVNGITYETSYCAGNGGNKIFVFKDIPYVIVITAQAYGLPYGHLQVDTMMEEYILPAILD